MCIAEMCVYIYVMYEYHVSDVCTYVIYVCKWCIYVSYVYTYDVCMLDLQKYRKYAMYVCNNIMYVYTIVIDERKGRVVGREMSFLFFYPLNLEIYHASGMQ